MRVKRVDELLSRLVEILDYKRLNYQSKLEEYAKKTEIEKILSKYPKHPFKGLIELETEELNALLNYFVGEYDSQDIETKKYWMLESEVNESLKETKRYKQASALFTKLGDKLQEYLETLKGISYQPQETTHLLDLTVSLINHLKNDQIIYDISKYYDVLTPSQILVEEDIYGFLVAISLNNLKLLKAGKNAIDPKINMTKEIREYLMSILTEQIKQLEKDKEKNTMVNEKLVNLSCLIDKISNNYDSLIDLYPTEIEQILSEVWDDNYVSEQIDNLTIPLAVIKGKKQGLKMEFNDDELSTIEQFISLLKEEEIKESEREIKDKQKCEEKITKKIEMLTTTLHKIDGTVTDYFDLDDFNTIVDLLILKKQYYEYIKNVICVLNATNLKINNHQDEVKEDTMVIDLTELYEEEQREKQQKLTKVKNLLEQFNINYQAFPNKLLNKLATVTSYEHLNEMLAYIDNHLELTFVKKYADGIIKTSLDKKINDIKCSQLYYLLVYSTPKIMDNLIMTAKENNLALTDIFAVPRVFASQNDDGTYEYFMDNLKFIKQEYPEVLAKLVSHSPAVLGVNSELFRHNVEATQLYNMSIISDHKNAFPSPRALATSDFEYVIDRYIEAGEYDYVERFRSQLETNYMVALRFKYLQLKGIDIKESDFDTTSEFKDDMQPYLKDLSIENIPVAINEKEIKWLDSINEEKDSQKQKVQYLLKGIYISRPKVLKYYSTLLINKYDDKNQALFYSLVKDSYLTKEEFNTLHDLIYNRKDM